MALMDARNYTLALFEAFVPLADSDYVIAADAGVPSPLWTLGKIAWQQEWLTLRFDSDAQMATALPLLEDADVLFAAASSGQNLPPATAIRTYLMEVMDAMLDALSRADDCDEALHPFRSALLFEDQSAEALHIALQTLNLHEVGVCRQLRANINANHSILLPDCMLMQGTARESAGFSFDNEYEAQRVQVPEFEIDVAPVTWAQYADFITDGGYDELSHWSREGLAWLTHAERRVPLYVEQAGSQVIVNRFGRVVRVDLREPVRHVTLWEAQAYAHWAGRRLPAEVEWLRATSSQQFTWGALHEWTASRYRDFAGYRDVSAERYGLARNLPEGAQAVCGASFATSPRLRDARVRYAFMPDEAQGFIGFRTCAI